MSTKGYRVLCLGILGVVVVAMLSGLLPTYRLDFALGQYGYPSGSDGVDIYDPTIGEATPATIAAPRGLQVSFPVGAELHWEPDLDSTILGLSLAPEESFPVNGLSPNGRWLRITIATESAWVLAAASDLPTEEIDAILSRDS